MTLKTFAWEAFWLRDGHKKSYGGRGWGIFEPQEFFSLSNSLCGFFLGRSMNIF